jgi:hypothetical protein
MTGKKRKSTQTGKKKRLKIGKWRVAAKRLKSES